MQVSSIPFEFLFAFLFVVISGLAKYEGRVDYEANYEFHTFKEDGAPSGQGGVVVISLKIYGTQI